MMIVHVLAGSVALLAGVWALLARKGARGHVWAGLVFVVAMLVMALSGTVLAVLDREPRSVLAGVFAAYLVTTAWLALRPTWLSGRLVPALLMLLAFAAASYAVYWGWLATPPVDAASSGFFGIVTVLAALAGVLDLRCLLQRVPLDRRQAVRRHAWRMLLPLLLAMAAFFLGQPDVFPTALQPLSLRVMPVLLVALAIPYWMWRLARRGASPATVRRPAAAVSLQE